MKIFFHIGQYFILLGRVFQRPERYSLYFKQFVNEIEKLGVSSIGITFIISIFTGIVITMQTAYNVLTNPMVPSFIAGLTVRDMLMLEFSNSVLGLILAGKVGSNIASELGTMRVTEQIDAMEIMGVNSASYLIMPKILAAMFFNPFLNILSIGIGIFGGYLISFTTKILTPDTFVTGLYYHFEPYYIIYSLIKTVVFAFIITSVSAYNGYYVSGGALEVGRASTRAVVYSSILLLLANVILTQFLLS